MGLLCTQRWKLLLGAAQDAMRIELANLEDSEGKVAHVYQPEELDLLDEQVHLSGPASLAGRVKCSGSQVFVTGHIEARARVECGRCLKPVDLPLNTDFKLEYITDEDYKSTRMAELPEEAMSLSVFDGETIDVDEIVREQVLLLVPARTLCQEECKGICLICGADRNLGDCHCEKGEIDPRWAALKHLADRE
jgi:uncharacterized protein